MSNISIKPDYIFEVSWEICNKVGGIYTVLSTKAVRIQKEFGDNLILIGPDVWKETREHPDFIEDRSLFRVWRESAEAEGHRIKVGRWNITGKPLAILVDFTPYFSQKDKIFSSFWENYKLDSLSGQWDYIEPAMFGYASARVIESFYEFNLTTQDRIIAQFHEWMTGTGILYLKDKMPQAGTVFTTHATVLGRSIAGNGMPLYGELESYNPEAIVRQFGVASKFSLERTSAQYADAFTTVSNITARECKSFLSKEVNLVTPNGFDDSFVPVEDTFTEKREAARKILLKTAGALRGKAFSDETVLVVNSGRYEFKNKGIDLFVDALKELRDSIPYGKEMAAFITVPANHTGPNPELRKYLEDGEEMPEQSFLSHGLYDVDYDPLLQKLAEAGLKNSPDCPLAVVFVPCYLDGADGIYNVSYYDLLIGFDLSVFPSYYEPWGYTPLESLAFHIPTVTTSLAGFGQWVREKYGNNNCGIAVVERDDTNDADVVRDIAGFLKESLDFDEAKWKEARQCAFDISRIALWDNLVSEYFDAYSVALEKSTLRYDTYKDMRIPLGMYQPSRPKRPEWKKLLVRSTVPDALSDLHKLSRNLWWSWNPKANELFRMINPELWEKHKQNPIAMLSSLTYKQMQKLQENKPFNEKLAEVTSDFNAYMEQATDKPEDTIAYFSMEYGLHDTIKIYSGGLGMLAGDYMKEASDSNLNMIGVGLLYRYGYFRQKVSALGDQIAEYFPQQFSHLPIIPVRKCDGEWVKISIAFPGRNVYAKAWKIPVGRNPLYLLDTDIEENMEEDRFITHQLYGGDNENRLKQELLLGVGGIRLLETLEIEPDIYHLNEGHAAFIGLERLRKLIHNDKLSFSQALEVVRSSSLFTTHTPVPAGHDKFAEDILRTYIPHYADRLNLSWDEFINLGKMDEHNPMQEFSMSVLAMRLSQEVNGVSQIHGRVSREMFNEMFPGYYPDELHIGYVTNGVHMPTWTSPRWKKIYRENLSPDFEEQQDKIELWEKIFQVADRDIWEIRTQERHDFIDFLKERLHRDMTHRQESPRLVFETIEKIDENAFTIGFARRFATYKRAHLLFKNPQKLAAILNDPERPVQLIFAGKAHPHDGGGNELIRTIVESSRRPEYIGKIIFLENYDMELGHRLTSGVDLWLNTPIRPMEASGTSGMKAVMNGVLNLSVLDGWWAEGYDETAGWALPEERTYESQTFQDELDAESIYNMLSEDIIPLFYNRKNNIPEGWVNKIKNNIAKIAPNFTMKRMIDDYIDRFYEPLIARSSAFRENNFDKARELSSWKRRVMLYWDQIEVISEVFTNSTRKPLKLGDHFHAEIELNISGLNENDIGMEVLFARKEGDVIKDIISSEEMTIIESNGQKIKFACEIAVVNSGVFDFAFRLYPQNDLLANRQDFSLIRWI